MRSIVAIVVLSGLSGLAIATPIEAREDPCLKVCWAVEHTCATGWYAKNLANILLEPWRSTMLDLLPSVGPPLK
ncbi:hypothetical protein MY3296_007471 [Beauveria thailandica]